MRIKNKLPFISAIATILLVLTSCDSKDDGKDQSTFDRGVLIENSVSNLILPAYQDFSAKSNTLVEATTAFETNKNGHFLIALQNAWKDVSISWEKTQPFNYVGPSYDSLFVAKINNYPTDPASIEAKIASTETINNKFIENQGTRLKGLPAIEYLIFNPEGNNVILQNFIDDNTGRRIQYLKSVAENIKEKADNINTAWNTYKPNFLNSTGSDAGSSTNLLANSLIQAVENIKNIKIGEPLGKKSPGGIKPEKVEAYYSKESIALIKEGLKAVESSFTGKNQSKDGVSFEDYLIHVDAKWQDNLLLSERIKQQFQNINSAIDEITVPLDQAVVSEANKVDKVYNALTSLVSLLKGEMVSKLGLTVTYSDNDGD